MRNKRVKKQIRLLSLLLCAVMVLGILPVTSASAAEETLTVSQSSVQLPKNSSVTVTAACSAENVTPAYQWQIRVPGAGIWVDISGETGAAIRVNYGMVASLLSGGAATIRAKATIGSGTVYTGEVTVNVTEAVTAKAAASAAVKTYALPRKTTTPAASVDKGALAKKAEETKVAEAAALEALNQAKAELEPLNQAVADAQQAVTAAQQAVDAAKQALDAANTTQEASADPTGDTSAEETTTAPAKSAEELQAELAAANEALTAANAALEEAKANAAPAQAKVDEAQKAYDAAKAASDQAASAYSTATVSNDATTTYNVVINYAFENGDVAAEPYTASLAAGSNFSTTVTFPTVQGYLPYVDNEQKDSITLNYTAIAQDQTTTVVYKPTNVNYTVIHYQQNLNDDKYTEAARETKQGLTNSAVPEVAKKYEGFYALLYEKPAIAADGSTLVEVYYDRYYYLMNFDLDGGYGVEPIYARYGSPIDNVGTPTKAGYKFSGWSLDGTTVVSLPETMPAKNRTYKAVWEADNTAKVTVVFWGENADDEGYSYIKSAQVNVKPGTEFTYSESGALICALEVHTHGASCGYACNQTEHSHKADCYVLTCTQELHVHDKACCTLEEHTHDLSCLWGVLCGKVEHTHGNGQCTCPKKEHTHTDYTGSCYSLSCTIQEHVHSDDCGYNCNKTEHTHTSDCYMSGAGLDSNLWKFVRSDTVTVAADGSSVVNVYYDRTEFTLTFKDSNRTVYTIKEKWGADISEHWPIKGTNGTTYDHGERWKPSGSKTYTEVLVYLSIMPAESFTLTTSRVNYDTFVMHYMVEVLPGESGTKYNGKTFKESFKVTANYNYVTQDEDFFDLDGFTQWASNPSFRNGQIDIDGGGDVYFYYTRNSYNLTFNDGYNDVKTETVQYEAPLSTYSSYVPEVPSAYEPGSVTFGGWYLNPECTGAEYKLDEHTMPADNVLLYAKWVPVTHTVSFYLDQNALNTGTKLITHPEQRVSHGSKLESVKEPTNGGYTFVGWFYLEDGVEKAFDPANMPVTKDLQLYGKWSSNVLKKYTIYYKIQGTDTQIAAPTTGSGLAGITKTFDAKGGAELYTDYQEGYFPVTKSHSLTLDIENDANNVYTFWYVQKEAVPYTVKYLNKETGEAVATEKTVSNNRKAVVTETFVPVKGMLPDAYQKRLVVSAEEGAVNEIIFYYTEDTTHAYYKITHYTENLATDADSKPTWTEYASSQAVGDIGTTYRADPMTIPGFTYDSKVPGTVTSGELTANGLELKLYYTRNNYPYQVRYLEQGTSKQLDNPKNGTGKYGEVVSESAIDIDNYEAVAPTSQTLNIRIEEGDTAVLNVITFYYKETEVTINYQVVGPEGCGTVTPTSETVKVLTGTAQGSTATAASADFRFVGWFTDEACTQPVDSAWVDANNKLTPVKADNVAWESTTYYAKFEMNYTTLKIRKAVEGSYDSNDVFIFDVVGNDGARFSITLKAGESKVITKVKVGATYTVTERTGWSSRYQAVNGNSIEQTLKANEANEFAFTNELTQNKWLTASSTVTNTFKAIEKAD